MDAGWVVRERSGVIGAGLVDLQPLYISTVLRIVALQEKEMRKGVRKEMTKGMRAK